MIKRNMIEKPIYLLNMNEDIKQKVLDKVNSLNGESISIDQLALAVGEGKEVCIIQVNPEFKELVWDMLAALQIHLTWDWRLESIK